MTKKEQASLKKMRSLNKRMQHAQRKFRGLKVLSPAWNKVYDEVMALTDEFIAENRRFGK